MTVTFESLVLERFAPWLTPDADPNGDYAVFLSAVSAMAEPLFSIVWDQGDPDDPAYLPGYGSLFSLSACPFQYLAFLAQVNGTDPNLLVGADDATARAIIGNEGGQQRGTPAAVVAAAQRWLSGTQSVTLFERTGFDGSTPDAYFFNLVVLSSEIIDLGALTNAVNAVKPGGVMWQLVQTTSWTVAEFEAAEATVTAAETDFSSVVHLETDVT